MSSTSRRLTIIVIIAALVPAAFAARWGYHEAKAWRARILARDGMDMLARHDISDAEPKLQAAYALAPFDLDVLRSCAKFSVAANDPQALVFYRGLLGHDASTRADRRDAVTAALSFNDLNQADEWVQPLTGSDSSADDKVTEAKVRWQQDKHDAAIDLMRKAIDQDPSSHDDELLLARMLQASNQPAQQTEAEKMLRDLGANNDLDGLHALEMLAPMRDEDETSRQWVLDRLKHHPLLDDEGKFAMWDLEVLLGTPAQAVLKEATDTFKGASVDRRAAAGRWLNNRAASQHTLELIPDQDAMGDRNLLLVRLDALAYLKNWPEVQTELNNPRIPLPQAIVLLYRARADQELGDTAGSQADWTRAIEAATGDVPSMTTIGQYALQIGAFDQAEKAYQKLAQMPGQAESAYLALIQIQARHGTTAQLRDTLVAMIQAVPKAAEPRNDWAYLSLLLNADVDTAFLVAQKLEGQHPELLAFRSTLALAYLRKNDPAAALKVYDGFALDWTGASPSWRLVHAVVEAANGNKAAAQAEADNINRTLLRPEEQALLDNYIPQS
jgi:tetratricopeptide (TPR) repeat protein